MLENAVPEEHEGVTLKVFRGSFTKAFDALGISKTYYRPVRTLLENSGAIIYVRGGGRRESTVALIRPLSDEDTEKFSRKDLTRPEPDAMLIVVAELQDEVERLKAWRKSQGGLNIGEAMTNFEERITQLESGSRKD